MQLSRRLRAVADMISPGSHLADVGTDHAYIPIALVQEGRIPHAIAMDVREGPLSRAKTNIRAYGLEEKIETRLSDGLEALLDGEAQTVLIAGMGGLLAVRILDEGKEKLGQCQELVLQPQSELRTVRKYLEELDYRIVQEKLVLEDGAYYPMLRAVKDGAPRRDMSETQLRFGPVLLKENPPLLAPYLKREEELASRVLEALQGKETQAAQRRREEVLFSLEIIRQARAEAGIASDVQNF